jgi:predicted amidohydrolase
MAPGQNLADLFAVIWRQLQTAGPAARESAHAELESIWTDIDWWGRHFDEVLLEDRGGSLPQEEFNASTLTDWIDNDGTSLSTFFPGQFRPRPKSELGRQLVIARAIDRWYGKIFPELDTGRVHNLRLQQAFYSLRANGRFNNDASLGQVIPLRPRFGRWSDIDVSRSLSAIPGLKVVSDASILSWFDHLNVLPRQAPATHADVRQKRRKVNLLYEYQDDSIELQIEGGVIPKVGFAPLAESIDDIEIKTFVKDGVHWYDVHAIGFGDRIARAVDELCEQKTNIIVFPEMTLNPGTRNVLRTVLGRRARNMAMRNEPNSLWCVVAGSSRRENGDNAPYNEAEILNHRGRSIGSQRKLSRWNLDVQKRERYGLHSPGLMDRDALHEFITPGAEVTVIETAGLGRIVVMICEDLSRSSPGRWIGQRMLLDWMFTPILDASIQSLGWVSKSATARVRTGRHRMVVANSVYLTHRQNRINQEKGRTGWILNACGIGLCLDRFGAGVRHKLVSIPLNGPSAQTQVVQWDFEL